MEWLKEAIEEKIDREKGDRGVIKADSYAARNPSRVPQLQDEREAPSED